MPHDTGETSPDAVAPGPAAADPAAAVTATPAPALPERPAGVPEAFWDAEAGAVRTDALLEAHRELEDRLGVLTGGGEGGLGDEARDRLLGLLGRPASAEGYELTIPEGPLEPDPELNGRLHAAGFTQAQAQLVYELAAERLVPVVAEVAGELGAQRQVDRLQRHFGGPEAWAGVARQIRTWAEGNLEPEAYAALASSHDGVLALHRMMSAAEPELLDGGGAGGGGALDEEALGGMVNDPRYWRRRDPAFVARVTEGFRRLYGG